MINAMLHPDQNQRPSLKTISESGFFSDQILSEPKLQELMKAVLNDDKNKDSKKIAQLCQEVENLNKRL